MYKINISHSYFQNNLRVNQESKDNLSKSKAKFLLTEQQKQFIQMHLPKGYKINIASEIDQKRNRIPKKTDAQFDNYYFKKQQKKQNVTSEKKTEKNEKKQEKRGKQRHESIENSQQNVKTKKIQEQMHHPIKKKQSQISKKNSKNSQIQSVIKKNTEIKFLQIQKQSQKPVQQKQFEGRNTKNQRATEGSKKVEQIIIIKNQQQKLKSEIMAKQNTMKQQINLIKNEQNQNKDPQLIVNQQNQSRRSCQLFSTEQKQFCSRFISKLKSYKSSWPFRLPVDPINQGVPNYLEIIHEPMDLKTIQKKINSNKYQHIAEFHGDINKIFLNSYKFNPKQTNYYTLTMQLESYYHQLLKQLQKNPNALEYDRSGRGARGKLSSKHQQDFIQQEVTKKAKITTIAHSRTLPQINSSFLQSTTCQNKPKIVEQPVAKLQKAQSLKLKKKRFSEIDRKELIKKVMKLSSRALQSVVEIAFGQVDDEKTTFCLDFQNLSDQVITKIQNIVRSDSQKFEDSKSNGIGIQTRMMLF